MWVEHSISTNAHSLRLDLSSIGQTIELLTVNSSPSTTEPSTMTTLPTTQAQPSADSVLQELKSFIQQSPADIVPMAMEPKTMSTGLNSKSSPLPMNHSSISRQARTANTYGGTPVMPSGNRPGTAVKSTISSSASGATLRKTASNQSVTDDRMFFARPTTIGQGQYHHRTGLMSNPRATGQPQQQLSEMSLGPARRLTSSSSIDQQQPQTQGQGPSSMQRRPLSWFQ